MEPAVVRGKRNRLVSRRLVWLRSVLAAVLGAVAGHLPLNVLIAVALSIIAVFIFSDAASATPALIPDGQFESVGALGVAVDQSTSASGGDVYVAGYVVNFLSEEPPVAGRVNKYDASGNLISPPSPFAMPPPALPSAPEVLAYAGAAVDPVNGNVYALDFFNSEFKPEVDTYDPSSGALLSSFPVPSSGFSFSDLVGIAADPAGNVYVPVVPQNEVLEYSPTGTLLKTFTGSGAGAVKEPTAVAVDSSGDLWVADAGNQRIEELSPAGAPLGEIPSQGVQAVALDTHGHVFATVRNSADSCGKLNPPCPHLVEYSSTGVQLADLGAGTIGAEAEAQSNPGHPPDMVAVNDSTGRVYVSEAVTEPRQVLHSRVFIYEPPTPPKLESEFAVGVTTSEAKLGALVNPGGIGSSYRFEYGTTTAYGHSTPFPEGDAGTGLKSRTVWGGLSGLQPGTTYHYRVIVANELGQVQGEDRTFTTEMTARAACPNDLLRTGFSAALPDCRAYELVTPPNKFSAQPDKNSKEKVESTLKSNFAAPDGNRLAYKSEDVQPGSPSAGFPYLATRGQDGWSSENLTPPVNYYGFLCPGESERFVRAYSEDFSKVIYQADATAGCPEEPEPELVSGEPRGVDNLFVRDNTTGSYQLVDFTPSGAAPATPEFAGASADLSRVVFAEPARLTPDALEGVKNIYEWSAGHVRLVSMLASGTAVAGSFAAVSSDGSRIFFTAGGGLYARVNGAETVQLDASQAAGPGGGGKFLGASQDGSKVVFSDDASAALTADTVPGSATNLYLYDSGAPAGQRLTDLTPVSHAVAPAVSGLSKDGSKVIFTDDASAALTADTVPGSAINLYLYDAGGPAGQRLTDLTPASHAEVKSVTSVSEDGSSVYFKAEGVLTGSQANQHGEVAHTAQPNLYLSHGGATTFIANITAVVERVKVSANGSFLAFETDRSLAGFLNTDPNTGKPHTELYLYDAATGILACASCNPSGDPPTTDVGFEERPARNLTENGRLFFDSSEALLPSDTNSAGGCSMASLGPACTDVYEFEPDGVGTCAAPAGCLFLISTGTSTLETYFVDASANGNDVFIREFQSLVPLAKQDEAPSIYDVRVNGGFPEPAVPPACATADACRSAPAPPPSIFGAPASQTFSGVGNLTPPASVTPKTLTNVQKLAKALATCKKHFPHNKKKRQACEKAEHQKYKAKKANRASRDRRTSR
jgi:hypothetical protein